MARRPRKCNRKPSLIDEDSEVSDSSDDDAYSPSDDEISLDSDMGEKQAVLQAVNKLLEISSEVIQGLNHLEEVPSEQGVNIHNGMIEVPHRIDRVRQKRRGRKEKNGPPLLWEIWEDDHEKWIDENLENDADFDGQNDIIPETAEPSSDLIIPLLRYQKEWLAWAFRQEESPTKGGILADEMGMGKTAQAIALVLAKRECCGVDWSAAPGPSTGLARINATLVICPVVAVSQWVCEIDRFTSKGSTKVLVYHGAKRGRTVDQFDQYDFVITTYSIVESEFRRCVLPPRKKCRYCGKLLHKEKLLVHLKYFCGPEAMKTTKQAKQMTKKKSWSKKGKGSAQGTGNISDFEDEKTSSGESPLHSLKWERIILDEAHFIKDRQCNTAKAVLALQSSFKWALSGTPLQNRVGELYSLIRFLQIVPYSYYLCKDCDCRTLDYGASKQCLDCPHSSVRHFCWWNRYVANPIQARGNLDEGRRAMILLKHKVLRSILLRRTKKGRAADLALPPRIVMLRRDALDVKEEDYYISLYNESQAQFTTYVEAGTVMNNYAHIFDLLTRLRQAVDHPYLVVYSEAAAQRSEEVSTDKEICSVCLHPSVVAFVTACEHVLCKPCLDFSAALGQVSCPACSKPLTVDLSTRSSSTPDKPKITKVKGFKSTSILNRIKLEDFKTSTKIEALREEIMFMVERDGSAKGIVFSQFTSFLDLINYSLQKCGIGCVQLTGDMSISARDASIKRFTEDPECRIFLVSLKAGGVALNLTVASHVFVMDPWWNPAVERQAQDRIHRIGQYKPIRIIRFVIENTIEERILKLQEKKELVFEGTVGGSTEALGKLTEADLRFLFVT